MSPNDTLQQTPGDDIAKAFFSPDVLRLCPEEYVARHGHEWGSFSFHLYQYANPELGAWVRRVGQILFSEVELERCRAAYLTDDELEAVRRYQAEDF